jgi:hypothetical protein
MLSTYEEKSIILEHAIRECMSTGNNFIKLKTEFERGSRIEIPKGIVVQLDNYSDAVSKKERSIGTNQLIIKNEFEIPRDEVKKLLRDHIDHEALSRQNFRQQIRDNDPILLYKVLDDQFLIATSTDFATVHANLDEHVNMKSGECFTEFKARLDQVVLEWILLNRRKSVCNKNDKFIYPSIEVIEYNLKGDDFFKSKYSETEPLVTDQWLVGKLINCFSSLRIDPKVKNRYDVILKIQLDIAEDDKANSACYLKLCE